MSTHGGHNDALKEQTMNTTMRGAALVMILAAGATDALHGQMAIELRGGMNVPTFKIADAAKAGPGFGVGLAKQAGARTWLMADLDFGSHDGAEVLPGIDGPDIKVNHYIAKLGRRVSADGAPLTVVLNAGAGAMTFKADGGTAHTYPAINVGAKLIYGLSGSASLVLSPQGDIAFSKKNEVGTAMSWVWPFSAGLRITF